MATAATAAISGGAPLRGRAGLELVVQPFGYRDAARFWGISDPRLAVLAHSVVGGTPAYRRELVREDSPGRLADFDSWVIRAVLNPQTPAVPRSPSARRGGPGVVSDPAGRAQIEIDAVVLATAEPGRPRKILSLGEAKWDRVMDRRHAERLRRARDLLAVRGFDTRDTLLSCYPGAGFDPGLVAAHGGDIQLAGLDQLCAP